MTIFRLFAIVIFIVIVLILVVPGVFALVVRLRGAARVGSNDPTPS
jgi:hypothetical protein